VAENFQGRIDQTASYSQKAEIPGHLHYSNTEILHYSLSESIITFQFAYGLHMFPSRRSPTEQEEVEADYPELEDVEEEEEEEGEEEDVDTESNTPSEDAQGARAPEPHPSGGVSRKRQALIFAADAPPTKRIDEDWTDLR
jgi:hypothetical protein